MNLMNARWKKATHLGIALGVSAVSIWISMAFTREAPPPPPDTPGMKVAETSISLTPDAPQWKSLKVGPAAPASSHWADKVPARVQIDQTRASQVGSPLAGRVTNVYVELGQEVKQGDPLFAVVSPDIASLRADREKAALDLATADKNLERVKAMVAAKALPAKDEITASQAYHQAEVALRLADSKLEALKVSSKEDNAFTVHAPRSGVIVEKNILPAQEINMDPASPLMVIADLSRVWVVADIFEEHSSEVSRGTAGTVTFPALPGVEVNDEVEMVSSVVDPVRHSVPIRLLLDNPKRLLKPNMYAEVKLSVHQPASAVEVPASALVSDGAHQYVYVQEKASDFTRREVVAGSAHDGIVPVFRGLATGELVVEEGAILLENQIALAR
jgi:RND family efflux transporter MFP subunit